MRKNSLMYNIQRIAPSIALLLLATGCGNDAAPDVSANSGADDRRRRPDRQVSRGGPTRVRDQAGRAQPAAKPSRSHRRTCSSLSNIPHPSASFRPISPQTPVTARSTRPSFGSPAAIATRSANVWAPRPERTTRPPRLIARPGL